MKQVTCKTYFTAKEKAKEAIDEGYTKIEIDLDDDHYVVYYEDYLELDDVY